MTGAIGTIEGEMVQAGPALPCTVGAGIANGRRGFLNESFECRLNVLKRNPVPPVCCVVEHGSLR